MSETRNATSLTKLVPVPPNINVDATGRKLVNAKQATMLTLLGSPRADLTDQCQAVANPKLKVLMVTESVGPFRVTGLRPAVASLRRIMDDIRAEQPEVHDLLGTAGMLCVRHVRGIPSAISNHAWGTAVDLKIADQLDPWNDGTVQHGLTLIAPIFARHGWFWGAAFSREDGMHFECSDGLIRQWAADGLFGEGTVTPPETHLLSIGDRGEDVRLVQETLNAAGATLLADGVFGRETQSAVMRFQAANGLGVDGVVGRETWAALRKTRKAHNLPVLDEAETGAKANKRTAAKPAT